MVDSTFRCGAYPQTSSQELRLEDITFTPAQLREAALGLRNWYRNGKTMEDLSDFLRLGYTIIPWSFRYTPEFGNIDVSESYFFSPPFLASDVGRLADGASCWIDQLSGWESPEIPVCVRDLASYAAMNERGELENPPFYII